MSNAINGGMLVPVPTMAQMFPSGTYVDLLKPDPACIQARDIAHHTAMTVRYGGGVRRFYSVAEHAVLVADLLVYQDKPDEIVAAGLLHDAAEAYAGDVIAPLKYALRTLEASKYGRTNTMPEGNEGWFVKPDREMRGVYSELCDRIDQAIGERFDIDPELFDHPDVKTADMWALKIEAAALTFNGGADWRYPGHIPNDGELPVSVPWLGGRDPRDARRVWIDEAYHWFGVDVIER